ncbi:hypothetical protein SDC9_94699 [bioreactor metagenome]|uniref:Uncharacterized protein n=1 Tax=bioreactor metagenome TaxID=1076179 RepID=A0A645A5K9_9ZZZZ
MNLPKPVIHIPGTNVAVSPFKPNPAPNMTRGMTSNDHPAIPLFWKDISRGVNQSAVKAKLSEHTI